jgi:thiol-disulfide isomerase/thioredoxin
MRRTVSRLFLVALLCLLAAVGSRAGERGDPLANTAGKKAVVLLFIARDCPISNSYAPEIKRIITRYTPQKVAFTLVYPDPDTSPSAAKQHAKEYGYTCPLLLDPAHRLVRRAGATVTPEAAVFAPGGKLLYRGRVDDLYVGFGQRRDAATRHDLRDALDAVLSGRAVPVPRTQAIGCFL